MFDERTASSILALACLDDKVTQKERDALQLLLLGKNPADCHIVKYRDAAARLGMSYNAVKSLVAKGKLKKVYATGSKKAYGISEDSLRKLAS